MQGLPPENGNSAKLAPKRKVQAGMWQGLPSSIPIGPQDRCQRNDAASFDSPIPITDRGGVFPRPVMTSRFQCLARPFHHHFGYLLNLRFSFIIVSSCPILVSRQCLSGHINFLDLIFWERGVRWSVAPIGSFSFLLYIFHFPVKSCVYVYHVDGNNMGLPVHEKIKSKAIGWAQI